MLLAERQGTHCKTESNMASYKSMYPCSKNVSNDLASAGSQLTIHSLMITSTCLTGKWISSTLP